MIEQKKHKKCPVCDCLMCEDLKGYSCPYCDYEENKEVKIYRGLILPK
jgi:hypothetical protein